MDRNDSDPTTTPDRALHALFQPRHIAVIGASEKPGSVGRTVFENLLGFSGSVYPVNPRHDHILGRKAYPNVQAVPEVPDLAVIAVPAASVPDTIRACAARGIPAAVILSAGFRECGPEGAKLEARVKEALKKGRMRVLGPNCLGFMMPHARLNATFGTGLALPGPVACISQSGALCTAILDWSRRERIGFSAFVSVGSMVDVDWSDLLTHLGDDPETHAIVAYMESVGDARRFLSAAREVALTKPILVLKVGHTEAASKAAASHTGALTGSDAVLDAAFRRAGVLRVNTLLELFDMASLLAKQPRPPGPRLAIVTNAGGPGALATDALVSAGGHLATPSPDTLQALNNVLPSHWSHGNPVDILGDADPVRARKALDAVVADPGSDGLLVILTPQSMTDPEGMAWTLCEAVRGYNKPVLACWMGGERVAAGRQILNSAGIPTLDHPDTAARSFALLWRYTEQLQSLYETPHETVPPSLPAASALPAARVADHLRSITGNTRDWIQKARLAGRTLLTEVEAKQLLAAYGIPVVPTDVAFTPDDAVREAETIGYPVVIKLFSETLTHKAAVGGVELHVRSREDVFQAWKRIHDSVEAKAGPGHFLGVSVQPMILGRGLELLLGSSVDAQFGPVLLFGLGGHWVEALRDTAMGLPPLNSTLARRLMEQTRFFSPNQNPRWSQEINVEGVLAILVRFSQLILDHPAIAEVDINPLVALGDGTLVAVDARVVLHSASMPDAVLPRPAIRPYPARYERRVQLKDSSELILRPIRPEDEPGLERWHRTLSDRSVYLRYFTAFKLEQRVEHRRLSRICFVDYDREMVLVAVRPSAAGGGGEILGVGRWNRIHESAAAEFAVTVGDPWQRQGLGSQLLKALMETARAEGVQKLTGRILPANEGMQQLARKLGFRLRGDSTAGEVLAEWIPDP